jgi:heat shock protein HtpX
MNLFQQQSRNRRETWLLLAVFLLFFIVLGAGFDLYYFGGALPVGTVAAGAVGGIAAWQSYARGDRAVLASTHARAVVPSRLQEKVFANVVDEMAIAAGLPAPRAYIVPDPDPNAFATGRDPAHASIAVTEGLLRVLTREELQGVVAHEMAHIRNYDIRLMTVIAALMGAIALLSDWAARGRLRVRPGDDSDGKARGAAAIVFFVIWILAILLAPLISRLLAMAVSRSREYLADATGAQLTRNPMALASALEKLESAAAPTTAISRGSAHLCIADPLGRRANLREGWWADLFATHPPMYERINRLRAMAYMRGRPTPGPRPGIGARRPA